jgi:hypothetical protein
LILLWIGKINHRMTTRKMKRDRRKAMCGITNRRAGELSKEQLELRRRGKDAEIERYDSFRAPRSNGDGLLVERDVTLVPGFP